MLNLIKEIEAKIQDALIAEAKDPTDESIKAQIAEWKLMKKKLAVVEKISKAVAARITELETGFEEVVKKVEGNKTVVDGAIIEYTQKKGNTTVKYKEAVDYAIKMVNEAQKKVLEDFVKSVTKQGEIKNILSVTDPELEKYLIDLGDASGDELMGKIEDAARAGFDRLPKQVKNAKKRELKEGVADNIQKLLKSIKNRFKTIFSKFFKSMDKADKATEALQKAVKADPLKEDVTVESLEQFLLSEEEDKQIMTYNGWKTAAKKVDPNVWFDGDKDIDQALTGTKPFKKGETKAIGEWDGEKGVIYNNAHLKKKVPVTEAQGINKGIRAIVASIEAIDMESDSDSLDLAALREIMVALDKKWEEPGVPGSDETKEAKLIIKVGTTLKDFIKILPKPEVNESKVFKLGSVFEAIEITGKVITKDVKNEIAKARANKVIQGAVNDFVASPSVDLTQSGIPVLFDHPSTGAQVGGLQLANTSQGDNSIKYDLSDKAVDQANKAMRLSGWMLFQFKDKSLVLGPITP